MASLAVVSATMLNINRGVTGDIVLESSLIDTARLSLVCKRLAGSLQGLLVLCKVSWYFAQGLLLGSVYEAIIAYFVVKIVSCLYLSKI